MNYRFKMWGIAIWAISLFYACQNEHVSRALISEPKAECLYALDAGESIIGEIRSFDLLQNNAIIVVTSDDKVLKFNSSGKLVGTIGQSGRAKYEFIRPEIVRTNDTQLAVWSAMNGKFIIYDMDGRPLSEFIYPSAVRDFIISRKNIFIYTAGVRSDHLIDRLDTSTGAVSDISIKTSSEHRFLLHNYALAPIQAVNDKVLAMSLDSFDIYDIGTSQVSTEHFKTPITIPSLENENLMSTDRNKGLEYLRTNPYVLTFGQDKKGYKVITLEGSVIYEEGKQIVNTRNYSIYYLQKGETTTNIARYPLSSMATPTLFCVKEGVVYYLRSETGENNERYYLMKLIQ